MLLKALVLLRQHKLLMTWESWKRYHIHILEQQYKLQVALEFHELSVKQSAIASWKVSFPSPSSRFICLCWSTLRCSDEKKSWGALQEANLKAHYLQ